MKLTHKNLEKVFNYIESQIEDENGRGEFDKETDLLNAVERTIEMLEMETLERQGKFKEEDEGTRRGRETAEYIKKLNKEKENGER